ncbi:MAG TPA: iron-containing redox enzyme family protein [Blastocatellia bacterium]|nr:iron-containing redox enzyme family protein [Blastocatellia bacterium]
MTFTHDLRQFVLEHGAVNNVYLARFKTGEMSDEEFKDFAVQFFAFVKHFPRILATLLANTDDDAAADELAVILTSELGDGDPRRRHEYLYHKFLRSIDIDPREASRAPWLASTRAYIEGLAHLYGHSDYQLALGASFGLEHMAISMWDQLIPGIIRLKKTRAPLEDMNTVYWTFHRALEQQHEDAMMKALDGQQAGDEASLREGCRQALDLLEAFWAGLDAAGSRVRIDERLAS